MTTLGGMAFMFSPTGEAAAPFQEEGGSERPSPPLPGAAEHVSAGVPSFHYVQHLMEIGRL